MYDGFDGLVVSFWIDEFGVLVLVCGSVPPVQALQVAATTFYFVFLNEPPLLPADAIFLLVYADPLHYVVDPQFPFVVIPPSELIMFLHHKVVACVVPCRHHRCLLRFLCLKG